MNYQSENAPDGVILIVDDNEQTSLFIKTLIEDNGFKCIMAGSGESAVKIVETQHVDLVLLDVILPDVNGFTIASKIKLLSKEFLPVIMVTALSSVDDKIAGLTYADDYITKPFSGDELIARVGSLLRNRRLHMELSQSKQRFELLYENIPHLYLSLDSDMKISDCNSFFRQTFNITREEITGSSIFTLFVNNDHPVLDHFIRTLQQYKTVKQRVFQLKKIGSGVPAFVNLKASYIGDSSTGLYIVIAMEDLTQQLKIQEEQKIARKQLYKSARLASIGTLASGVAHEMNNPLTAILGFSSAIMDRFENKEIMDQSDLQQYLEIINTEALRCRDIVENLARFAREGGECIAAPVQIGLCIENALKLIRTKLSKACIEVENSVDKMVVVAGDSAKIEQVIVNVLTNCIDFRSEQSKVSIISSESRDDSKYCAISFRDNGLGINQNVLPKVFDPFFTTKEVGRGTGMGLAICHRIMEDLNGSIDVHSDGERGTTVVLEFVRI